MEVDLFETDSSTKTTNGHHLKITSTERMRVLVMGDIILLIISVFLALWAWAIYDSREFVIYKHIFLLIIPWLLISVIVNSYGVQKMNNLVRYLSYPVRTAIFSWGIYIILYFFAPIGALPRIVVLFFGTISCSLLILWRFFHFMIFTHRRWRQRVLIVGSDRPVEDLKQVIAENSVYYELVNFLSIDSLQYFNQIKQHGVDRIVYTSAGEMISRNCLEVLLKSREMGIAITPVSAFYEELTGRTPVSQMQGWHMSFLFLREAEWSGLYPIIKRMLDIFFASAGLFFFMFFFPVLALIIKLDSRGSIFFSQARVGKNGRKFLLWKLRTMHNNGSGSNGAIWTEENDVRITRSGRFLRKTHLDEFPQLWNVIKGEVSIVGVRPLSVQQCDKFAAEVPYHNLRHLVKPGITSWAIINFKHVNDLLGAKIRLEYDLYYIKHQSFFLDLYIIIRTIWIIVTLRGL